MRRKMLKSTVAIVLSIALAVTGLNTDIISQAASITQKVTQEESKITAKQKEDAKREDEKVKEKLKDTKESKEKNKKATVVKELKELRNSNSTTYLLSDGSKKLEICGEDIRYKENGKYVDYDSSLKKISKSEEKEYVVAIPTVPLFTMTVAYFLSEYNNDFWAYYFLYL